PVDGAQQVIGGFLGHAFEADQVLQPQLEDVGDITYQLLGDQLFNELVAQAFNIERTSSAEVPDRLLSQRRAHQGSAAAEQDVAGRLHLRAACRTFFGHVDVDQRYGSAGVSDHLDDLGNDVAGAADDHLVADVQTQPGDLGHVVQGGVADGDTAHKYRFESGHRWNGAGAPDVELDIAHPGGHLLGRYHVGHCPARGSGVEAQFGLQLQAVHLEDSAINLVVQIGTAPQQLFGEGQALVGTGHGAALRVDAQAPAGQQIEGLTQGGRQAEAGVRPIDDADAVAEHAQRPLGSDAGIELAQRAGSGVAGVDEGALTLLLGFGVHA